MSHDSSNATILIRRSSTRGLPVEDGTGKSLIQVSELAYSLLQDPNDNGLGNGGDRLYIGAGSILHEREVNSFGDSVSHYYSSDIHTIGGKYFTDMMNHQRGEVTAASALLVDDNKKLNELLVDLLYFNKDSVSTEATNDLVLRGGTGLTKVTGNLQVTQNVVIDGSLTVDGVATLRAGSSGSIFMGDQNTDNVVFGAEVNSSIIPNITDTYDLGTSLKRWNAIFAKGVQVDSVAVLNDLQIGGNLNVDGLTTLDSTTIDGQLTVTNDIIVSGTTTLNGPLNSNALSTLATATVTGTLNVDGLTTLDSTTIDGDLTVNRNLYVLGEQTNISTSELLIEDRQIVVANGTPSSLLANGAGIAVGDSATPFGTFRYIDNGIDDPRWEAAPKIYAEFVEFDVIDCGKYA